MIGLLTVLSPEITQGKNIPDVLEVGSGSRLYKDTHTQRREGGVSCPRAALCTRMVWMVLIEEVEPLQYRPPLLNNTALVYVPSMAE